MSNCSIASCSLTHCPMGGCSMASGWRRELIAGLATKRLLVLGCDTWLLYVRNPPHMGLPPGM